MIKRFDWLKWSSTREEKTTSDRLSKTAEPKREGESAKMSNKDYCGDPPQNTYYTNGPGSIGVPPQAYGAPPPVNGNQPVRLLLNTYILPLI